MCHRIYSECHGGGINVPLYRYRYNMQIRWCARTPEMQSGAELQLSATRVVLAPRRHPERRSSIAISPTHRDSCFQSKISIPCARASRYFPRVPLSAVFILRSTLGTRRVFLACVILFERRDDEDGCRCSPAGLYQPLRRAGHGDRIDAESVF